MLTYKINVFQIKINENAAIAFLKSDAAVWQTPKTTDNVYVKWHKDSTNTFDYTTITDQHWTVNRSDNSHPTGVVNLRFRGPTSQLPAIAVQSKGQTFNNL